MHPLLSISANLAVMAGNLNMPLETKDLNKYIICNFLNIIF